MRRGLAWQSNMMLFWLMLIANSIALIVSIFSAIITPTLSYRIIGVVALCAFLGALHQVVTARSNPPALLFNLALVVLMRHRMMVNLRGAGKNGKL